MADAPFPKVTAYIQANRITFIVWALIVIVIVAAVSSNRANKAATLAKLNSTDKSVQLAEVRKLAEDRNLADALSDTEDPNSPADSDANVASSQLREAAAADFDTLVTNKQVTTDVAVDNLFMLHKDADAGVKADATAGLVTIGKESDANIKMLAGHLSDGDPDVRSASSDALGTIGGVKIAQLITPLLRNEVASDSAQAALVKIGAPAIPLLTPLLDTSNLPLSSQIIGMLATIGDTSAIPALMTQVNAQPPVPTLRRLSIIAIANLVLSAIPAKNQMASSASPAKPAPTPAVVALAESTIPIFVQTLDSPTEDSLSRARSALALGRLGGPDATTALVKALGDYDVSIANSALTGAEQVGAAAVPALTSSARSPEESVRIAAATALGGIGNNAALEAIQYSLKDPSANVRTASARALGTSANAQSIPLLIPMLSDSSGKVAAASADALTIIGAPAIPQLVPLLGSANPAAAFYASQALMHIGPAAVPAVTSVLTADSSETEKVWAAVTLGDIRDKRAQPALTALAGSGSTRERWAADQAIQQLG